MHLRVALTGLGALAGVGIWALIRADTLQAEAPGLFLVALVGLSTWSGVVLALSGPLRLRPALAGGLALALPAAALMWLAGQRYANPVEVLSAPGTLAVFFLMVFIATPFLSVALRNRSNWLSYSALFETAWAITIRFSAAMLFAAVVWGFLLLSDALLGLVDLDMIERALEVDGVPAGVTGAALGLGVAVIHELRDVVSPLLPMRLLRLLVWPIVVVVAVFLLAVPMRGLSGLVGQLSPAATLMGVALGAITLVTSAVGRTSDEAVSAGLGPRLLSLSLPCLAGLAVWAIAMRIAAYGLTPERVLAVTVALVLLLYGLAYGAAALRSATRWMEPIRRANVGLALLSLVICAAWLTPLLNADRLSARSQLARFVAQETPVDALPLRRMAQDWGRAGQAALQELKTLDAHPAYDEVMARLHAIETQRDRDLVTTVPTPEQTTQFAADLADWVPVQPSGQLQIERLETLGRYWLGEWHGVCAPRTDASPPCVFVQGQFAVDLSVDAQGLMIVPDRDGLPAAFFVRWPSATVSPLTSAGPLPADAVGRILKDGAQLVPLETEALLLDGRRFAPGLQVTE
ncbi:MAG: hypothetical protein AAGF79_12875 [Pseudomonadota bacterium]